MNNQNEKAAQTMKARNFSSSEFVSSGHPDRVADNCAACLIDKIQKKDGVNSHAAIEVFLTADTIIYGGEATTTLDLDEALLRECTRKAFELSGYYPEARKYWTREQLVLADDLKIINMIKGQSPDIALGTTDLGENSGYNDQGVFFSSADNSNRLRLGSPMFLAKEVSDYLKELSRASILEAATPFVIGPDNKVVITCSVDSDGFTPLEVASVVIAVPHTDGTPINTFKDWLWALVKSKLNSLTKVSENCTVTINGTGKFVTHGSVSDCSLTGRKISVNHPSAGPYWCNKMIGGGSLVKPYHASDLILNLASRFISNILVYSKLTSFAVVGCACAIGDHSLRSLFIYGDKSFEKLSKRKRAIIQYFLESWDWSPIALAKKFGFFNGDFDFAKVVDSNFFGESKYQWWEREDILKEYSEQLLYKLNHPTKSRI